MAKVEDPIPPGVAAADPEPMSDAAATQANLAVAPELLAESLPDYLRAAYARIRGGASGVLPGVGGLVLISGLFQAPNPHFLTAINLVNLLIQGAPFMLLAMAEVYALLLGEID